MSAKQDATTRRLEQLQREIANLRVSVQSNSRGSGNTTPRRGRGGARGRGRSNARGMPAAVRSTARTSTSLQGTANGTVTLSGREPIWTVTVKANKTSENLTVGINPLQDYAPPDVSAIGKLYQMYKPLYIRYAYEPMCGSTTSGAITMAVTQNGSTDAGTLTQASVARCQPNCMGPLYATHKLSAPPRYLREKEWYETERTSSTTSATEDPIMLLVFVEADSATNDRVFGRIYMEYSYTLSSFRPTPAT